MQRLLSILGLGIFFNFIFFCFLFAFGFQFLMIPFFIPVWSKKGQILENRLEYIYSLTINYTITNPTFNTYDRQSLERSEPAVAELSLTTCTFIITTSTTLDSFIYMCDSGSDGTCGHLHRQTKKTTTQLPFHKEFIMVLTRILVQALAPQKILSSLISLN